MILLDRYLETCAYYVGDVMMLVQVMQVLVGEVIIILVIHRLLLVSGLL